MTLQHKKSYDSSSLITGAIDLHNQRKYTEAQIIYEQILKVNPLHFDALRLLGTLFAQRNQFDQSLVFIQRAYAINPHHVGLLNNYGNVLKELKRYDEALLIYNKAINVTPNNSDAHPKKEGSLFEIKSDEHALTSYKRAIDIRPGYADAAFNCGLMLLHNLDFANGWTGYEARWHTEEFDSKPLLTSIPQWQGIKSEKRLFIWAEQGIGDQILYGSLFNELKKFPQKKIISADKKLISVFQRSFPDYQFIDKTRLLPEDFYDEQIPIGNLGQYFRKDVADFKNATHPYLIDDPIKTQRIKLSPPFVNRKTCGISWRSANQKLGKDKSVSLLDLLPVLSTNDMQFINLQYGDTVEEVANLQENHQQTIYTVPEIDIFNDIDGVLSIISACDLIITTSNSTAHLAGALGKETLLLTPYSVGKFWYWHDIDGVSLWYPSVRVFPQTTQGDWAEPINAMKAYLGKMVR